ncbi:3-hydroxybutyrate dehydrogenase [Roseovarius salinarum]|uniref:3-hydroxybutyrate dehydrogenase n=1 Tax=Roseovarius salinarum TaxID=1981892 RepID=UPI000C330B72|nr:3-hydroxybutyrate dehydrogenase [Roseovarius salinarum]
MVDLTGKTALVTGSVQGIGLAVAEALAGAGARIAVHGLAGDHQIHEACTHLRAKGAPQAEFFHGDLRQPERIDELMAAVAAWGGADILVNNAGIQHTAPLARMPRETWDTILQVNLSAAFETMQAALPGMAERGYGRVINIASVHGLVASKDKAPYVAAKHGLVGLSRVAALEYAGTGSKADGGVTVNCICPGWTETEILAPQIAERAEAHGGDRAAGIAELLAEKQPSRRTSDPAEIGALALWLCDPIAHNVTGTAIPVDGGWTAQ